jgi:tetratricopeptide (TPR) repeat protein
MPFALLRRLLVLLPLLCLSACSIYSSPGSQPPQEPPAEQTAPSPASRPAPPPTDRVEPGAVAAYQPLLERAAEARQRGDYEQSLALLERAQRIDPDSAAVYLAMAETHMARGDRSRASATAERGLLYCNDTRQCAALRAYTR